VVNKRFSNIIHRACIGCRYKMISAMTWPNFKHGSDRYGTQVIVDECQAGHDVQYGKTKIFIRSPQTLFELERRRTDKIPSICITLQKVRLNAKSKN